MSNMPQCHQAHTHGEPGHKLSVGAAELAVTKATLRSCSFGEVQMKPERLFIPCKRKGLKAQASFLSCSEGYSDGGTMDIALFQEV